MRYPATLPHKTKKFTTAAHPLTWALLGHSLPRVEIFHRILRYSATHRCQILRYTTTSHQMSYSGAPCWRKTQKGIRGGGDALVPRASSIAATPSHIRTQALTAGIRPCPKLAKLAIGCVFVFSDGVLITMRSPEHPRARRYTPEQTDNWA